MICDWWISIRFVCFCVSRFVACDRNYDWRQRKTQLWRRLLNFRVRMFVKSAVNFVMKSSSKQTTPISHRNHFWDYPIACEQALWGALAVRQRKESLQLCLWNLNNFHLQFPCGSPSTELSDFHQSMQSGKEHECKQTAPWRACLQANYPTALFLCFSALVSNQLRVFFI